MSIRSLGVNEWYQTGTTIHERQPAEDHNRVSRVVRYKTNDIATSEDLQKQKCNCLIHSPNQQEFANDSHQYDYKMKGEW